MFSCELCEIPKHFFLQNTYGGCFYIFNFKKQFLKKSFWHRCFSMSFAKFLRTPLFTEHLRWLLLNWFCSWEIEWALFHISTFSWQPPSFRFPRNVNRRLGTWLLPDNISILKTGLSTNFPASCLPVFELNENNHGQMLVNFYIHNRTEKLRSSIS